MNENFFTRVPDALYDALRDSEITPLMFNIMLHLHRWANWETGIVQTVNAKRLRAAMGGNYDDEVAAERTIQRALQGLDEAGWIISGYVRGMKQPYGVQITNYQPIAGEDGEKALLIPMATKHWTETKAFQGGDEDAEKALTQAVKRRLKELDCSETSSHKTVHKTSIPEKSVSEGVSETLGATPLATISAADSFPCIWTSKKQSQALIDFLGDRFTVNDLPMAIWNRVLNAHPDFVATPHNLDRLREILDRWNKKRMANLDDFAHAWESQSPKGLYGQLQRVCINEPEPIPEESRGFDIEEDASEPKFLCREGVLNEVVEGTRQCLQYAEEEKRKEEADRKFFFRPCWKGCGTIIDIRKCKDYPSQLERYTCGNYGCHEAWQQEQRRKLRESGLDKAREILY